MKFPRRLAKTADGRYCEENDPEAAFLVGPAGMEMADIEADRLGITEYFTRPDAKAIDQSTTEDKAIKAEQVENKSAALSPGVHHDPAARRGGRSQPEQ
jgi:hypothetical protein